MIRKATCDPVQFSRFKEFIRGHNSVTQIPRSTLIPGNLPESYFVVSVYITAMVFL